MLYAKFNFLQIISVHTWINLNIQKEWLDHDTCNKSGTFHDLSVVHCINSNHHPFVNIFQNSELKSSEVKSLIK